MYPREQYLKEIISKKDNGRIKIITGLRRSGKSVLLFQLYREWLLGEGVKEDQIIALALDILENARYRNPLELDKYVRDHMVDPKKRYYIFIDEIQFVSEIQNPYVDNEDAKITFIDVILGFMHMDNADVYVTGSNSKMLSSDILTQFRDRGDEIRVYPLSFAEFYSAVGGDERKALDTYMLYGGMPRLLALEDDKDKKDYLTSLYSELYVKDIVERNGTSASCAVTASSGRAISWPMSVSFVRASSDQYRKCHRVHEERKNQSCDGFKLCAVYYRLFPHFNGKAIRCQRKDLFQVSEQILLYGYRASERTAELPPVRSRSYHGKHDLQRTSAARVLC